MRQAPKHQAGEAQSRSRTTRAKEAWRERETETETETRDRDREDIGWAVDSSPLPDTPTPGWLLCAQFKTARRLRAVFNSDSRPFPYFARVYVLLSFVHRKFMSSKPLKPNLAKMR